MNLWWFINPWRFMNLWSIMNLWRVESRFEFLIMEDSYEWISTKDSWNPTLVFTAKKGNQGNPSITLTFNLQSGALTSRSDRLFSKWTYLIRRNNNILIHNWKRTQPFVLMVNISIYLFTVFLFQFQSCFFFFF